MSAPNTPPASDATPGGTSATGGNSQGSPTPGAQDPGSASPDSSASASGPDYLARIRTDPAFAEAEVRKHQSAAGTMRSELQGLKTKVGGLLQPQDHLGGQSYLDRATGDQLVGIVSEWASWTSDPAMAPVIDRKRKDLPIGGDPSSSRDLEEEDVYMTETERNLASEVKELKGQLTQMQGQIQSTSTAFGADKLQSHLQSVLTPLNLPNEKVQAAMTALREKVTQLGRQGPAGQQAIENLMSPQGEKAVEALVVEALGGFNGVLEVARNVVSQESQRRAGLATDGPMLTGSQPDEPPPEFQGTGAQKALQALEFFENHPERIRGH